MRIGSLNFFKIIGRLAPILALVLFSACSTYKSETQQMRNAWYAGDIQRAENEVLAGLSSRSPTSNDRLIWLLEAGAVTRANDNMPRSKNVFEEAYGLVRHFESQPEISITEETVALLLNQSFTVYRGYHYDKIMLCVYQSLNFMEARDFERTAVELRRLNSFQQDAVQNNLRRIERESEELRRAQTQGGQKTYDVDRTLSTPAVRAAFTQIYGEDFMAPANTRMQATAVYVNPFAYWLMGIFFATHASNANDREVAATSLRLAYEMSGKQSLALAQDAKMGEDLANRRILTPGNLTYVIYEAGSAPIRDQVRITLPLFIFSRSIPSVSLNFPYLVKQPSHVPFLRVSDGARTMSTEKIADMDEIIENEFRNELPTVIFKTILSSAIKSGGQFAAQSATRGNDLAFFATAVGMTIFQIATNDADLRTWTTLPKQISIARINTPQNGRIIVDGRTLSVSPNGVNIVVAKKTSATAPTIIRSFNLNN